MCFLRIATVSLVLLSLPAISVAAHDGGDAPTARLLEQLPDTRPVPVPPPNHDQESRDYFTDLPLVNQDGKAVRFYTDVLKDRVVLINFIYTDCADTCPLMTYKLKQVKDAVGDRFGKEIFFVSISVDPENDPPEALKEFARTQDVDVPGWMFLTGDKAHIHRIVAKLGQYNAEPRAHSTLVLAGNVPHRIWTKIPPMATVPQINMKLEDIARGPQRRTGG
jgi:cytochrome oxidase Cu insertion factor (SCO1/SenC/PrrC family)